MLRHWWKVLSVILMGYVLAAGMWIPLSPGIMDLQPTRGKTGEKVALRATGYNSFYTSGAVKAWLRRDTSISLCASSVQVESDTSLLLEFFLPDNLPFETAVQDLSLILYNDKDEYSILPSAFSVIRAAKDTSGTAYQICEVSAPPSKWRMDFPYRNILSETIRNLYYHVPLWFGMVIILFVSVIYSFRYLASNNARFDIYATAFAKIGVLYGVLGLLTGALWAKHTWGAYWSWDVKQNMSAVAMLIYFAFFILRNSLEDPDKKARLSSVYNIFAYAALIPLIFVIPRLADSLHPGNGGNPGFGVDDLDSTMRMVFYPGVIAFTLFGVWLSNISARISMAEHLLLEKQGNPDFLDESFVEK